MIPLRTLSKANLENGVRFRVAACRKRLRNHRSTPRALNRIQADKQTQKTVISASSLTNGGAGEKFTGAAGHTQSARELIGASDGPVFDAADDEDREKVGIT